MEAGMSASRCLGEREGRLWNCSEILGAPLMSAGVGMRSTFILVGMNCHRTTEGAKYTISRCSNVTEIGEINPNAGCQRN